MKTIASLVNELALVSHTMWINQETLYAIRKMGFKDFKRTYMSSNDKAKDLWSIIQRACSLNIERNRLIDEIDELMISMIENGTR